MKNQELGLSGSVINMSSLLIRTGSWNLPPDMNEGDSNILSQRLYKNPRFKILGSFVPALAIREFGVGYATDIFRNFEKRSAIPFGISGLTPKVRGEDNTVHLALIPDTKTRSIVNDELSIMRSELKLDLQLPAVYPVIASFANDQHKELLQMANAFSEMLSSQSTNSPFLFFESPVIRF